MNAFIQSSANIQQTYVKQLHADHMKPILIGLNKIIKIWFNCVKSTQIFTFQYTNSQISSDSPGTHPNERSGANIQL